MDISEFNECTEEIAKVLDKYLDVPVQDMNAINECVKSYRVSEIFGVAKESGRERLGYVNKLADQEERDVLEGRAVFGEGCRD